MVIQQKPIDSKEDMIESWAFKKFWIMIIVAAMIFFAGCCFGDMIADQRVHEKYFNENNGSNEGPFL